ncbi:hypothetical protein AU468_07190 [Alkalispirochaeta sphaeroplastigenens]|uniref:Uncharacterized protein n=1 Tax=Alkalispirochaeta sphaeroplastigenens TaxID=1187066 RepID=A0A2S4JRC8_9SPIO|nr:hypothetical protein [Alkalispirochaeta sphaeroplastigenens]POR02030.1 hypothetical protein AU468_07190 [Alkalispirochaeta sphaeroplastigenens]
MQEPVLITGKQSAFTDDMIQEFLNRQHQVFATADSADEHPQVPDSVGSGLHYLPWSRRSLLSARSVMLALDGETRDMSRAVVVCAPEGIHTPLHQTESALIEQGVDAALKGYLFILKEVLGYFLRRGSGDITVVWYDGGAEVLPPFDATLCGAVQGLVRSLFAFYEGEAVTIRGLQASESDSRAVARWVAEQIIDKAEKSSGRWQKYGQRSGLLSFKRA